MNQQNIPGNDPNQLPDGAGTGDQAPPVNPYYGKVGHETTPDLDAGAPHLRSVDEQRLNRKALLFLGGILVLVLAMGFLLVRKGGGDVEVPKPQKTERVSTPELPNIAPAALSSSRQTTEAIPLLPPAPAQDTELVPMTQLSAPQRHEPSLLERRIAASDDAAVIGQTQARPAVDEVTRAALLAQFNGGQSQQPQQIRRGPDVENVSSAGFIRSPDALLVRGTYLRCVLETRIVTDIAGYTSCLVTEPVYSINGRNLLLPKGSKIYGSYGGGPIGERVEVIWDRITTPNGIDVAMSSPGVDQLGGAGHPGQYSAHWGQRIASALMISLLSDAFKYAAAEHGPESTTITSSGLAVQSPYESATARTMERLANEALSQRRPPTVTINQGTIVNVYVAKDVDFTSVLNPRH